MIVKYLKCLLIFLVIPFLILETTLGYLFGTSLILYRAYQFEHVAPLKINHYSTGIFHVKMNGDYGVWVRFITPRKSQDKKRLLKQHSQ